MSIVALDLSLAGTGVARLESIPEAGPVVTWAVKGTAAHASNPKVKPDHLWQCERNGAILALVKEWCDPKPDLVVIEDVFIAGPGASSSALPLSQLAGLIRYWLHCVQKIPFVVVIGQATKKFAGVPKSKPGQQRPKGLICKFVQSSFGHDVNNDNEADSIAMTYMGAALMGSWQPKTAAQREVIAAIRKKNPWLDDLNF